MKYTFAYKTSDGIRHEDSMNASSREEVFNQLRAKGIKAIKVVAADGSKANGEIRGVRKRIVALWVCIAILITGGLAYFFFPKTSTQTLKEPAVSTRVAKPLARQIINGDRQRIEDAVQGLSNAVERLLAAFAEPGRTCVALPASRPTDAEFEAVLRKPLRYAENEFTESVDLKRIVAKIKSDLQAYLSEGGTIDDYLAELVKRQKMEVAYREKAERNLAHLLEATMSRVRTGASGLPSNAKAKQNAYDYWLKANAQLQSMGIYPLPLPDQLRGYQSTLDLDE